MMNIMVIKKIKHILHHEHVDLIVGAHPHTTHYHFYINKTLVASSLGNFPFHSHYAGSLVRSFYMFIVDMKIFKDFIFLFCSTESFSNVLISEFVSYCYHYYEEKERRKERTDGRDGT